MIAYLKELWDLAHQEPPPPMRPFEERGGGPGSLEVAYELERINSDGPDIQRAFFRTYIIDPGALAPEAFRERLQEVWRVIASWGRWSDDEREEWPSVQEQRGKLPAYFAAAMSTLSDEDFDLWLEWIENRGWTWWSRVEAGTVKVTFEQDEMATWWVIELTIEKLGGKVEWIEEEGKRFPFEALRS